METIIIGKDAQDNWDIINESSPCDIWFHLNSFPSCHVIIRDCTPTQETIQMAAELCKEKSKYKHIKNIKVVYTTISNLELAEVIGSVNIVSRRKCKFIKP